MTPKRRRHIVALLKGALLGVTRPHPGRKFVGKLQRETVAWNIADALRLLQPKRRRTRGR